MHTDNTAPHPGAEAIVAAAQARSVPVISYKQLLDWVDGRNSSTIRGLSWNAGTLTFVTTVGAGANGLQTMLPVQGPTGTLTGITRARLARHATRCRRSRASSTRCSPPPPRPIGPPTPRDRPHRSARYTLDLPRVVATGGATENERTGRRPAASAGLGERERERADAARCWRWDLR